MTDREPDEDLRREAIDERRRRAWLSHCQCGDLPGRCPGPMNCPIASPPPWENEGTAMIDDNPGEDHLLGTDPARARCRACTTAGKREERMMNPASRDWQVDGSLIYRLVRNGDFRRGSPVVVNEFTISVQTGHGTTVADATLLAQGIADLLNADTKYRAKEPA